jgi:hypothetical protein
MSVEYKMTIPQSEDRFEELADAFFNFYGTLGRMGQFFEFIHYKIPDTNTYVAFGNGSIRGLLVQFEQKENIQSDLDILFEEYTETQTWNIEVIILLNTFSSQKDWLLAIALIQMMNKNGSTITENGTPIEIDFPAGFVEEKFNQQFANDVLFANNIFFTNNEIALPIPFYNKGSWESVQLLLTKEMLANDNTLENLELNLSLKASKYFAAFPCKMFQFKHPKHGHLITGTSWSFIDSFIYQSDIVIVFLDKDEKIPTMISWVDFIGCPQLIVERNDQAFKTNQDDLKPCFLVDALSGEKAEMAKAYFSKHQFGQLSQ